MKKKTKKIVIGIAAGVVVFVSVQLIVVGWMSGRGPFRSLQNVRRAHLPGNGNEYDFSKVEKLADSPLAGKTVLFLGSSVMRGEAAKDNSLPEYFAGRTGCEVIKEAVSGTTLVDSGPDSYVQRLKNSIPEDVKIDLLICQLSTNDASQKKPLGELGDVPYDTSTVTGAMEEIVSYAQNAWGCKVAFFTGARYDNTYYGDMVVRLHELSDKRGVGVLDLWSGDTFNDITKEQRKLYMDDTIHPTKAGYRDWWCPELERQLFAWLDADAK